MDSHLYRNVHDENPFKMKWIVIRTEMCMTKTHSKINGSHSYRNVHDKNPYTRKWIVIRTEIYMKKTHTRIILIVIRTKMYMTKTHKNMDSHSYKDVHDENPYKNIC